MATLQFTDGVLGPCPRKYIRNVFSVLGLCVSQGPRLSSFAHAVLPGCAKKDSHPLQIWCKVAHAPFLGANWPSLYSKFKSLDWPSCRNPYSWNTLGFFLYETFCNDWQEPGRRQSHLLAEHDTVCGLWDWSLWHEGISECKTSSDIFISHFSILNWTVSC